MHEVVVPMLDAALEEGRDRVWCASLELAWRELQAFVGGAITAKPELVARLNASAVQPDDVDPADCIALAGLHTQAWVQELQARVRARFGDAHDLRHLPLEAFPDRFVAYACVAKSWRFATPFQRLHGWMRFAGQRVDSFSLGSRFDPTDRYERLAAQVLVHHHEFIEDPAPDDEDSEWIREWFVIELVTDDPLTRLVLALRERPATLADAVAWTIARLRVDPRADLDREEKLEIPCIDFDLTRRYDELRNAYLHNPGFEHHGFGDVLERVRFHLDEGGAELVSESEFRGLSLAPRTIVFDTPFLVLALRRGCERPFLAMWIETTDLLVRAG